MSKILTLLVEPKIYKKRKEKEKPRTLHGVLF